MGKYFLLGGAGFIGQNLANVLLKNNNEISIYDRNIESKISNINLINKCNIIDNNFFIDNQIEEHIKGSDCIVHLISSISPQSSMQNIYTGYDKDVMKIIELCEICISNNIKRIVFISSGGTVYGNNNAEKYHENMQNNPINNYGIVKLTIEKILLMYNYLYHMENIILRLSNPYGLGQNPKKKIGAVTVFADNILSNKEIQIYGNGDIVRDYVEINDVCRGVEASINYNFKQELLPIFNIGSGVGTSIKDLIKIIEEYTQIKANIKYFPSRSIDVKYNVLDITKAEKILNYKCQIDIKDGIKEVIYDLKKMRS